MAWAFSALSGKTVMTVVGPLSSVGHPNIATVSDVQLDELLIGRCRRFREGLMLSCADGALPSPLEKCLDSATVPHDAMARSGEAILGILDRVVTHPISGARQTVTEAPASNQEAKDIAGAQLD